VAATFTHRQISNRVRRCHPLVAANATEQSLDHAREYPPFQPFTLRYPTGGGKIATRRPYAPCAERCKLPGTGIRSRRAQRGVTDDGVGEGLRRRVRPCGSGVGRRPDRHPAITCSTNVGAPRERVTIKQIVVHYEQTRGLVSSGRRGRWPRPHRGLALGDRADPRRKACLRATSSALCPE